MGINDMQEDVAQLKADYQNLLTEHKKLLHLVTTMAAELYQEISFAVIDKDGHDVNLYYIREVFEEHFNAEVKVYES